ncbi:hypothetical protein CSOJ01_11399 [Colletotrichum sojae]|uniref:Uncharacterized protein n=1 Tax=Colletotrichum sojae TaxID=2175907 RepID=A0A8H6MNW5_9PEZI|nr:hypothetical protein CSOJ01_11399 [Colletotrichum sojae]
MALMYLLNSSVFRAASCRDNLQVVNGPGRMLPPLKAQSVERRPWPFLPTFTARGSALASTAEPRLVCAFDSEAVHNNLADTGSLIVHSTSAELIWAACIEN